MAKSTKKYRPALTPESDEQRMIAMAFDLAAKQLQEGTASSQVITHFLKMGAAKERIEREILEKQRDLIVAKTEEIKAQESRSELYDEAIRAMRMYSGNGGAENDEY